MTPEQLAKLEETIADAFIRSNVLSLVEAEKHAGLAVCYVRNALGEKQPVAEQAVEKAIVSPWIDGVMMTAGITAAIDEAGSTWGMGLDNLAKRKLMQGALLAALPHFCVPEREYSDLRTVMNTALGVILNYRDQMPQHIVRWAESKVDLSDA
jgi:hypothetical protein